MTPLLTNLFEYNVNANRRVWDCAMTLSDEDYFRSLEYSVGSIFDQLVHTMGVEHWWPHFMRTDELDFITDTDPYRDRAYLRAAWDRLNEVNLNWLRGLTAADLAREVREDPSVPAIRIEQGMMQVILHSMDHRSQTLAGLYKLGAPTIEQDYLYYLYEPPTADPTASA